MQGQAVLEWQGSYIQGKGIDTIRFHAIDFITTRLAQAHPEK
jgi:hypothetical protein